MTSFLSALNQDPIRMLFALVALFLLIPVVIALIKRIIKAVQDNHKIDMLAMTENNRYFEKAMKKAAINLMAYEYKKVGKPIKTQKNAYRVNFMNDVEKEKSLLLQECCPDGSISEDFCIYVDNNYPNTRVKDLSRAIKSYHKDRESIIEQNHENFLSELDSISPAEFFEIKQLQHGDVVGVYVIHNESRDMYYVGQAKRLFFRINQHFTGHGNGDVYADYKYGDDFSIKIVKLSDSGYSDLDLLEKDLILRYHANTYGYNKTRGNS